MNSAIVVLLKFVVLDLLSKHLLDQTLLVQRDSNVLIGIEGL